MQTMSKIVLVTMIFVARTKGWAWSLTSTPLLPASRKMMVVSPIPSITRFIMYRGYVENIWNPTRRDPALSSSSSSSALTACWRWRRRASRSVLSLQGSSFSSSSLPEKSTDQAQSGNTNNINNNVGPKAPPPGLLRRMFPRFPWHQLPNALSLARCAAVPALLLSFHSVTASMSGLIFALANLTDAVDGYLARRWDVCSDFGAFVDPVADKLLVATALVLCSGRHGAIVAIPSTVIVVRELAVSALREWMATRGQRDAVQVGWQGKVKTAMTMITLSMLLHVPGPSNVNALQWKSSSSAASSWLNLLIRRTWFERFVLIMLYLSALITVTSGSVYFQVAAPLLGWQLKPTLNDNK